MWGLEGEEGWALKDWCFWTVVLEKTLESPLDCKEFQPVHPKGNQSWVFIARTDAEAETPILWPPDVKSWVIQKDPDAGKDWKREEKGMTEDEMVGWHHRLNGHEFEQAPGVGDGQGSLMCCSPWNRRVAHDWVTELNWVVKNPPANSGDARQVQSLVGKIPQRRKWKPTLVFLPGKYHGWSSLAGYSLWGCKESDATKQLTKHTD